MRPHRRLAAALLLLAVHLPGTAPAQPAAAWAAAPSAAPGPVRIVGGTSLGCIQGAEALPTEGPGFQAVRLSRNRNWGHPATIRAVQALGLQARRAGLPDLWIGDMGQPRGGPLPYGHASHQAGPRRRRLARPLAEAPRAPAARESIPEVSLVLPDQSAADPRLFTEAHARLIRLAAELPGVDRVLVNHGIKRSLCAAHAGEPWLRRVRPWRGHDSHLHLRLRCPADSPECQELPPPPAGDGCDASLAWWLTPEARQPPRGGGSAPPRMPAACAGILVAR